MIIDKIALARLWNSGVPASEIAARFGTTKGNVSYHRRALGLPTRETPQRPVPSDFTAVSRRLTRDEMVVHYRAAKNTITRWYKEAGINTPSYSKAHAVILGALTAAAERGEYAPLNEQLGQMAGVAETTASKHIANLEREGLITVKRGARSRVVTIAATGKSTAPLPSQVKGPPKPAATRQLWNRHTDPKPDGSNAGQAAQYLRRIYPNVYHRIIHGKQHKGEYQVGSRVMSEADLIAHAIERGYDPNAWRRAA